MPGDSRITTDHQRIRRWAERRGGHPATVEGTERGGEPAGLLRIDFPGYGEDESLEEISWDQFFDKFDEAELAFVYQNRTGSGRLSRFNKLVDRRSVRGDEEMEAAGNGQPSRTGSDVLELIEHDHREVQEILEKLKSTTDRAVKTRQQQLEKLRQEILPHMKAEESLLYPFLQDAASKDQQDEVLEAFAEHDVTRRWLKQVEKTDPSDEMWKGRFNVLAELINHHIEEEESELFDLAEDSMDDEQAEEMGAQFTERKQKVKT